MALRLLSCLVLVVMVTADPLRFSPIVNDPVTCPDGQSQCPSGQTCCMMISGLWGCCPLPNAKCCSDKLHCCPHDSKCSPSTQKCIVGNFEIDWFEKTSALPVHDSKDDILPDFMNEVTKNHVLVQKNVCPDGASLCPDTSTCCRMKDGSWGCCPQIKAVCCDDYVHCCPEAYTCAKGGLCRKGFLTVKAVQKVPAEKRLQEMVECPGGKVQCNSMQTCCASENGYQCCPLPKAVCCKDKEHCCPHGYICDDQPGICRQVDDGSTIAASKKVKGEPLTISSILVQCSATKYCLNGQTCCKTSDGDWGCCPLPNAECCDDHLHCCPSGYTCDSKGGGCNHANSSVVSWMERVPAVVAPPIKCSATVQCAANHSCCKGKNNQWGCCPLRNATCCSDGLHCCPANFTCHMDLGRCVRGDLTTNWLLKKPAHPSAVQVVTCPDGSYCPSGNTCCRLTTGQYGCCPVPNAVCCSDGVHCCPSGYTCNSGKCTRETETVKAGLITDWFLKKPAHPSAVQVVTCPDGSSCPSGNTCCRLTTGQYGCCPVPNAVCCSDGVHCCPSGYTCDSGKCARETETVKADLITGWFLKKPAHPSAVQVVTCPDGSYCPSGNTCCRLTTGQYGCCPVPNAVCCSDGVHCCPSGYMCNAGKCTRETDTVKADLITDWFLKKPTHPSAVQVVTCPDGSSCPSGNTCCRLTTGQYGCCPVPNAVCCSDGVHCCPSGYTCNSGQCVRENHVVEWFTKTLARMSSQDSILCPGGRYRCPSGNTCCKTHGGQYLCCPLPKAVCCSDGLHCCPHDYECGATGTCRKSSSIQALKLMTPGGDSGDASQAVMCPDGEHECPSGNTCCKLSSGQWGCCPIPKAICCSDDVHCCPNGYQCSSSQKCVKGTEVIDAFTKTLAMPGIAGTVRCPGGKQECPSGNTCCKLVTGNWGCCPILKAVCCSDGVHCCPEGYSCDPASGTCNREQLRIPMVTKTQATTIRAELTDSQPPVAGKVPSVKVPSVLCPNNKSRCSAGMTCCMMKTGQWGCCHGEKAVCCADGLHCCPQETVCDADSGQCKSSEKTIKWSLKSEAVQDVICPDGEHACPDGNTCCKLASGDWGCCPLPQAVCCSDGVHCCPGGYVCDVSTYKCRKGALDTPLLAKNPARRLKQTDTATNKCSDSDHVCPKNNVCCSGVGGKPACCPLQGGTCCTDGLHCCAKGYICDSETNLCIARKDQQRWDSLSFAKRAAKGGTIMV